MSLGIPGKTKQSEDTRVRRPACYGYCVATRTWLVRKEVSTRQFLSRKYQRILSVIKVRQLLPYCGSFFIHCSEARCLNLRDAADSGMGQENK